ncbi:MAG: hypothetical protein ACI4NP_00320 [Thermoguttaceae bacterium]
MKDDRELSHGEIEANKDELERLSQQEKFVSTRLETTTLDDFLASFETRGAECQTRPDAGVDGFNAEIERQVKRGKELPPKPRDPDSSRFAPKSITPPPQKSRVLSSPPAKPTSTPTPKSGAASSKVDKPVSTPTPTRAPQAASKPAQKPVAPKATPTSAQETPRFRPANEPSATSAPNAKKPAPRFDPVTGKPLDPSLARQIEALKNQNQERRFDPQTGKPIIPTEEEPEIFLEDKSTPAAKKNGCGPVLFFVFLVAIIGSNYGPIPAFATLVCGFSLLAMINSIKKL